MFNNNFINNIVRSMMALCVAANGWSSGDALTGNLTDSGTSQERVDSDSSNKAEQEKDTAKGNSPILVNHPPYPAVKQIHERAPESKNNTKLYKAASGTREEIKTSPARTDDTVWKETKILGIGARLSRNNQDIKALEELDKLTESDSAILTQAVYNSVNIFPTLLKCINLLQKNSEKLKNLMNAIVSSNNYFSDDEDNAGDIENLLTKVVEKTDEY